MFATSSGVASRRSSEVGRCWAMNRASISAWETPCSSAIFPKKSETPSDRVGPGKTEFTVTPVPATDSASPRAMALRGLGHSVVDHLDWDVEPRLAGDEDDTTPSALHHFRQVVARQADAAHDIRVEEPIPIVVGDRLERLGLEDAEIVHENIGIPGALQKMRHGLVIGKIGGDRIYPGTRHKLRESLLRGLEAASAAAIDDHRRTRGRKPGRNREADSGRRSRDNGSLVAEIDDHAGLAYCNRRWGRRKKSPAGARQIPSW